MSYTRPSDTIRDGFQRAEKMTQGNDEEGCQTGIGWSSGNSGSRMVLALAARELGGGR